MTEKIERLGADLEARDKVSCLSIWKQTVMLLMTEMRIFLQNLWPAIGWTKRSLWCWTTFECRVGWKTWKDSGTFLVSVIWFHIILANMFLITSDISWLQKDLEDTKSALHDLEEKYNEAKSTIKEKEYAIFNLLKSGLLRSCLILFCSFFLLRLFGKFMYAINIQFITFQGFHGSSMIGFN